MPKAEFLKRSRCSPFVTSGLRIGTPAITSRGIKEARCIELTGWICDILDNLGDADIEARVAGQAAALCADFPVYRDLTQFRRDAVEAVNRLPGA